MISDIHQKQSIFNVAVHIELSLGIIDLGNLACDEEYRETVDLAFCLNCEQLDATDVNYKRLPEGNRN